jgi:hypothetical protein
MQSCKRERTPGHIYAGQGLSCCGSLAASRLQQSPPPLTWPASSQMGHSVNAQIGVGRDYRVVTWCLATLR